MFVDTFIRRPILASVCSLVIILAGVIAIPTLPIAQFPELAPPQVQVKAAGGVRDLDTLLRVRAIGVTRVGASRTAAMLDECRQRLSLPAIQAAATGAKPAGY